MLKQNRFRQNATRVVRVLSLLEGTEYSLPAGQPRETAPILHSHYNEARGQQCTRRTDHDLDHLDPNRPLYDVVWDLCSTDPTQETCPIDHQVQRLPPGNMS